MEQTNFFQNSNLKVGFIGVGSYGTALAQSFCRSEIEVVMVSDSEKISQEINNHHTHSIALPNIKLSEKIVCTTDYSCLAGVDVIFITVPAKAAVEVCIVAQNFHKPFVLCSKGLEPKSGKLLTDVIEAEVKNELLVWSGPSFAIEVAQGLNAAVNLAGKNRKLAQTLAQRLSSNQLTVKEIDDCIGLQVMGAFKNVLAVGCGMSKDSGCSEVAKFVTQGIQEIVMLTKKIHGNTSTFFEFGGIGDIFLTCTSEKSRNVMFGEFLAKYGHAKDWDGPLAEGALTAKWIPVFEERYQIELPILHRIYVNIYEN